LRTFSFFERNSIKKYFLCERKIYNNNNHKTFKGIETNINKVINASTVLNKFPPKKNSFLYNILLLWVYKKVYFQDSFVFKKVAFVLNVHSKDNTILALYYRSNIVKILLCKRCFFMFTDSNVHNFNTILYTII